MWSSFCSLPFLYKVRIGKQASYVVSSILTGMMCIEIVSMDGPRTCVPDICSFRTFALENVQLHIFLCSFVVQILWKSFGQFDNSGLSFSRTWGPSLWNAIKKGDTLISQFLREGRDLNFVDTLLSKGPSSLQPCEDSQMIICNQAAGSPQTQNQPALWSWISQPPEL